MNKSTSDVDPITMEVVQNALGAIADEMALVIMRTAYSTIVRDSMDYSTGVCDRHGRIIAHGMTMALHLGSFPDAMKSLIILRQRYALQVIFLSGMIRMPVAASTCQTSI